MKRAQRFLTLVTCLLATVLLQFSCTSTDDWSFDEDYDGETADDADDDVVGTDSDIYWEANTFSSTVKVVYSSSSSATVTTSNSNIKYSVSGGYVTIDMLTNSVSGVEIIASGYSSDGQLKIYGDKKFKLTLSGLELICSKGPAINDQCSKRCFVHLEEGTSNYLYDSSSYSTEPYYHSSSSSSSEDRKGCFFSEGNLIFSGSGVLVLKGSYKHGIVTDGYFYMRPGVTIAVTGAAKNAIHVKGDTDDGIGVYIAGGLIYANVSGTAGKCIKTDYNVDITGGKFLLNTSGGSEYDSDEKDTSSAACIKADYDVNVSGGTFTMKSTGTGGKGFNVDGALTIDGGTISVATSGAQFTYGTGVNQLTSSPKGIKADGKITINGGTVDVSVTGKSDGSEGIESKSSFIMNDGEVSVYAYDDAINATSNITINGGKVYAYAVNNDGIDSNGTLYINGGLAIAAGTTDPEESFDVDDTSSFKITGGTVIGVGGTGMTNYGSCPGSRTTQRTVAYGSFSGTSGKNISVLDSSGNPLMMYELPRTMSSMCLLFSSSSITSGSSYTISYGGTINSSSTPWNGYYASGTWSSGSTLTTFTSSSIVTTVGGSGNSGGGNTGPGSGGGPGH